MLYSLGAIPSLLTPYFDYAGLNPSDIQIVTGTLDLRYPYHTYNAAKIIIHEDYDKRDSFRNDICLIKVEKPITFDSKTKRIPLPSSSIKVNDGDVVTVSGWGLDEMYGEAPDKLQEVDIKIVNQDKCKKQIESYVPKKPVSISYSIYPTQLCAQDDDNSTLRGQCQGDSGGPLVSKQGILLGVVSWSLKEPDCGSNIYPAVFTRVTAYLDWIKKHK